MAATIHDVARLAGVNSSTVSRVLNGKVTVLDETREKIYAAMQELDYHPQQLGAQPGQRSERRHRRGGGCEGCGSLQQRVF